MEKTDRIEIFFREPGFVKQKFYSEKKCIINNTIDEVNSRLNSRKQDQRTKRQWGKKKKLQQKEK